jgi:hypothetical protein
MNFQPSCRAIDAPIARQFDSAPRELPQENACKTKRQAMTEERLKRHAAISTAKAGPDPLCPDGEAPDFKLWWSMKNIKAQAKIKTIVGQIK